MPMACCVGISAGPAAPIPWSGPGVLYRGRRSGDHLAVGASGRGPVGASWHEFDVAGGA